MSTKTQDKKQKMTRIIALVVAIVMVGSVVVAAILSQIW